MSVTWIVVLAFLVSNGFSQDDFHYSLPNYSYYKFDNGFELILVENHINPLIATVVVVRTGLRNEKPANNGVSHVLEHMTFNGTEKRTQKELYDELDFYGIYLNAQTSEDYTAYMALNHKEQNAHSMNILSDMLFHSVFPPEKFKKEKGIIAEEIRKDRENPGFKQKMAVRKAFYRNPPYSMPVIGTAETVSNMTRQQVMKYYRTYYSPNNMITIAVGDFSTQQLVQDFRTYFGQQPPQEVPQKSIRLEQTLPFLFTRENDNDQTIYLKFPAPTFYSDWFIPFQFLLQDGLAEQKGRLIKSIKSKDQLKIKRVQSSYEFHPEFGILTLKITTEKGIKSQKVQQAVEQKFRELKRKTIPSEEIRAIKQQKAISDILQMEKILYYGFLKAQDLAIGGLDAFEKKIPAFLQLTEKQIRELLKIYPDTWAHPDQLFTTGNQGDKQSPGTWTGRVKLDRYRMPARAKKTAERKIYRRVLDNGLTVLLLRNTDSPVLAMHFLFKNRSAWEPPEKTGIADFLHHLLFKETKNMSADELQLQLQQIGAEIKAYDWDFIPYDDYYNVPAYSYIRLVTLDHFFDKAMQIAADNILYPEIDSSFAEVQGRMKALVERKVTDARYTGKINFLKMLFGEEHPLSQRVSGTPATISAMTPADVKSFRKKYFSAGNTILTIVSSKDSATVFQTAENYFGNMPPTRDSIIIPELPVTEASRRDSTRIGSQQAYIYLGYSFPADSSDTIPLEIMNQMLSNRIEFTLREQKGWAYRIGSSINSWKDHFYLVASMGTGRQNTLPAIRGILEQFREFENSPVTAHSIQKFQNSLQASLTRRRASRENQAFTLGINEFHGLPANYIFTIYDRIDQVTPESVERTRERYLQTEKYRLFYTIPLENGETKKIPQDMPH